MNAKLTSIFFVGSIFLLLSCQETRTQDITLESKTQTTQSQNVDSTSYTNVFTDTITILPYDIPAQRFDETAQALCHATGCFIETDLEKTGSVHVNSVKGRMSILEAVEMAIKGTDLVITKQTSNELKIDLKTK